MLSTRQLQRAVPRGTTAAAVESLRQTLDFNKVRARPEFPSSGAPLASPSRGFPRTRADRPNLTSPRLKVFARDASTLPVTFQHRGTGGRSSIRCARATPRRPPRDEP